MTRRVLTRALWCAGAAITSVIAVSAVEFVIFRRSGGTPVPGPYDLDTIVTGPAGADHAARWVWLGDSLSAGVGAERAEASFPHQTAALVAAEAACAIELTCLAVPGAASSDVLTTQVPAALSRLREGMTAVVAVGCNDVLQRVRPRVLRENYAGILDALGATGATVVAVGLPDLASMMVVLPEPLRSIVGWAGRRMDDVMRAVAGETGIPYVTIGSGRSRRRPRPTPSVLSADRFHPNGAGYHVWAELVAAHLAATGRRPAPPTRPG